MSISDDLNSKIRYYIARFPDVEFSGTLFYEVSGSVKKKDLKITAIDFLLQDIGSSSYTEFDQSPDVIAYMMDKGYVDRNVYQGLMHSHHKMGAFFSATDLKTLQDEGSNRSHFLSLIVDTKGTYVAAITTLVEERVNSKGTIKYITFDGVEVNQSVNYPRVVKTVEYNMLEIASKDLAFSELDARISDVQAAIAKTKSTKVVGGYTDLSGNPPYQLNFTKEQLPPVMTNKSESKYTPVSTEKDYVKMLLTGDVCYNGNKTATQLAIEMVSKFDKRFKDTLSFQTFMGGFIEFLLYWEHPKGSKIKEEEVAAKLVNEIKPLPKNKYIDFILEELNSYCDYYGK